MTKTFLFSVIILLLSSCATYKALDKSLLEGKMPDFMQINKQLVICRTVTGETCASVAILL